MSEYPFNLKGRQENFKGTGSKDGEPEQSREFILEQGVVIAEIEHHGYGDFKLKFVPTGGFSEGGAAAGLNWRQFSNRCWLLEPPQVA